MKEKNKNIIYGKFVSLVLVFLATILLATITPSGMVNARSTPNEFIIQANNYDKLAEHATNCTFQVDKSLAVTYCADGYLTIDDVGDLINPDTAFKVEANHTFRLKDVPKDIRLDTYLSIVDFPGEKLTVIKRSTMEALHIELNPTGAPNSKVLGGFFSPDFVVFQISNLGTTFLQVHTSKT